MTAKKANRTSWPMIRISGENHQRLFKSQAKESAKRGKVISLVDWCNEVIEAGLRSLGHKTKEKK